MRLFVFVLIGIFLLGVLWNALPAKSHRAEIKKNEWVVFDIKPILRSLRYCFSMLKQAFFDLDSAIDRIFDPRKKTDKNRVLQAEIAAYDRCCDAVVLQDNGCQ